MAPTTTPDAILQPTQQGVPLSPRGALTAILVLWANSALQPARVFENFDRALAGTWTTAAAQSVPLFRVSDALEGFVIWCDLMLSHGLGPAAAFGTLALARGAAAGSSAGPASQQQSKWGKTLQTPDPPPAPLRSRGLAALRVVLGALGAAQFALWTCTAGATFEYCLALCFAVPFAYGEALNAACWWLSDTAAGDALARNDEALRRARTPSLETSVKLRYIAFATIYLAMLIGNDRGNRALPPSARAGDRAKPPPPFDASPPSLLLMIAWSVVLGLGGVEGMFWKLDRAGQRNRWRGVAPYAAVNLAMLWWHFERNYEPGKTARPEWTLILG